MTWDMLKTARRQHHNAVNLRKKAMHCRYHPGCLYGATSFVEAWVFAVITHTTVGKDGVAAERADT